MGERACRAAGLYISVKKSVTDDCRCQVLLSNMRAVGPGWLTAFLHAHMIWNIKCSNKRIGSILKFTVEGQA